MHSFKKYKFVFLVLVGLLITGLSFAAPPSDVKGIADKVTETIGAVGNLMVAIAYLAGFGFLMFGILKFKQHKDNPSQVTLGTPIVMTLIGAVLVFIGGFIKPLGATFGMTSGDNTIEIPGGSGSKP